jgi:hypothetical protein
MAALFLKLKAMYAKDGGAFPTRSSTDLALQPAPPSRRRKNCCGDQRQGAGDVLDPKDPTKVLVKAGEQVAGFAHLRDDGSTACGNWIYCGCWSQAGNLMARRDNSRSVRPWPDAELGFRLAG